MPIGFGARCPILAACFLAGACGSTASTGPYEGMDSARPVAELDATQQAGLCIDGWSWLVVQSRRTYSHAYCVNFLRGTSFSAVDECSSALEECITGFPSDDVADDICSRAVDSFADCDVPLADLDRCFVALQEGYSESIESYDCEWILSGDRMGSPLPTPEACTSLPVGCRGVLGLAG